SFGTVLDATFGQRAILDVLHSLVDDFLGHGDAGVAATAETLDLSDRGGAFIEAAAVFGAHVAPAAGLGLSLAGEYDGAREDVDELGAAIFVFFVAQNL